MTPKNLIEYLETLPQDTSIEVISPPDDKSFYYTYKEIDLDRDSDNILHDEKRKILYIGMV